MMFGGKVDAIRTGKAQPHRRIITRQARICFGPHMPNASRKAEYVIRSTARLAERMDGGRKRIEANQHGCH